jgi:hypothetical protein
MWQNMTCFVSLRGYNTNRTLHTRPPDSLLSNNGPVLHIFLQLHDKMRQIATSPFCLILLRQQEWNWEDGHKLQTDRWKCKKYLIFWKRHFQNFKTLLIIWKQTKFIVLFKVRVISKQHIKKRRQKMFWHTNIQIIRGPGFDSRPYQIFCEVDGLEQGPLSLVRAIEELLEWKSSGSGLENRD